MSKKKIEGKIKARSPIHSGGDEKTGNQTLLRRMKFYLEDSDEIKEIPFIAGNSVRGHIRRLMMDDFLEKIGYTVRDERLFHALYGGGMLQKSSSSGGKIDVEMRKNIREYIPPLSLLGSALGNQMISGVLNVSHMLPVCKEMNERINANSDRSFHELIDFVFHTRSDESNEDKEQVDYMLEGEGENDNSSAQQMKYEVEVFIPGTTFEHSFVINSTASNMEYNALLRAIKLWDEEGTIGGMASSGLGKIEVNYNTDLEGGKEYVKFLEDNSQKIKGCLDKLSRK